MTEEVALVIGLVFLAVACVFSTLVPLLYSGSSWRATPLGKVLMLQATSVAVWLDATLLFQFWAPTHIWTLFVINVLGLGAIAVAEFQLVLILLRIRAARKAQPNDVGGKHSNEQQNL